ncbi:hypothetical protein H7R39_07615 [Campylobacter sp. Marseille-Q3452]|uniref:Uncharacterized protein n=1 Tax=Campylobacter massiliensis TaxID=2762557 RepID=A0A842J617_9BACT|nr:hypothetical protein [Campylobacter massiliensis]MBC2883121.1 hypothetical protein [Campylobacter massiliensis]
MAQILCHLKTQNLPFGGQIYAAKFILSWNFTPSTLGFRRSNLTPRPINLKFNPLSKVKTPVRKIRV